LEALNATPTSSPIPGTLETIPSPTFYLGHTKSSSTNESTLLDLWETWTSSFGLLPSDELCLSREDSTFLVICHSDANNHITNALDNLTLQESFKGDEEVAFGNGTGLSIFHIGSSVL
jgi:hypothetical protein